ncbi:EDC3 [Branchiostoma lanceolatum]|uniref:Enhancer of mRNA-decapping protein 3 n=1 Tax=Branchiostoma lanceolatum TaxID=7740 RepID=A0A8J9ZI61_BRALA|nr:EDC3 [Branchiostoma lanceolatum]
MAEGYVGSVISVDCGSALGVYQGRVIRVNKEEQTITLRDSFRNGLKCQVPEITLSAIDIKDLKILNSSAAENGKVVEVQKPRVSLVSATPKKKKEQKSGDSKKSEQIGDARKTPNGEYPRKQSNPGKGQNGEIAAKRGQNGHVGKPANEDSKRNGHDSRKNGGDSRKFLEQMGDVRISQMSPRDFGNRDQNAEMMNGGSREGTPTKMGRKRHNSFSGFGRRSQNTTPKKLENGRPRAKTKLENNNTFSPISPTVMTEEFDFEKNLALFDKAAIFEELDMLNGQVSETKKPQNYRHDENILGDQEAVVYRQIILPQQSSVEFNTDCGLVVPSISLDLRRRLYGAAEKCGLSEEKQLEVIGMCSSQMALQLLGGSSRLNPRNTHQMPSVVVLCGPHRQGAQGISCARHLANKGVNVTVFMPNFKKMLDCLTLELQMFNMTDGVHTPIHTGLPTEHVDLIINTLDGQESVFLRDQAWYRSVVQWVAQNKAPVLAVDPPCNPPQYPIQPKWSLSPALPLPLPEAAGTLYLCDMGIPSKVYAEVGIKYKSPFGHKCVIALHHINAS